MRAVGCYSSRLVNDHMTAKAMGKIPTLTVWELAASVMLSTQALRQVIMWQVV